MPNLVDLNGILHVKDSTTWLSEPKTYYHYWSTGINTYDFIRNYGPIENISIESTVSYSGRYCFKRHPLSDYTYLDLINGAKTQSTKVDIIDIPCPKTRAGIKTRWNDFKGGWEKELKTGWCLA